MAHNLKRTVAQTFGFDKAPVSPAASEPGYNILRYDTVYNGAFCRIEFTDETVRGSERQVIKHRGEDIRFVALNIKRLLRRHPHLPTVYSEAMGATGILADFTLKSEGTSIKICRHSDGSLFVSDGVDEIRTQLARRYFAVLETAWQRVGIRLTEMEVRLEPSMRGRLLLANHFDENEWTLMAGEVNIAPDYERVAKASTYLD